MNVFQRFVLNLVVGVTVGVTVVFIAELIAKVFMGLMALFGATAISQVIAYFTIKGMMIGVALLPAIEVSNKLTAYLERYIPHQAKRHNWFGAGEKA